MNDTRKQTYKITPGIACACDVEWQDAAGQRREVTAFWAVGGRCVDSRERNIDLPAEVLAALAEHFRRQFGLPYGERGKVRPWAIEVDENTITEKP